MKNSSKESSQFSNLKERKKKKRDVIFSEIAFLFKDCTGSSVMLVPRFLHFISKKEKGVMGLTLTGSEVC